MVPTHRRHSTVSTNNFLLTLARNHSKRIVATLTALLFTVTCLAQDQAPPRAGASPGTVTIPAGTRLALVLTDPISSKAIHRGDEINAQTTAPIAVGDQVIIPAGAFVKGTIDTLRRNGTRGEMKLQSASVIFPDGYIAKFAGPLDMESEEGTAWLNPGNGTKAGVVIAPLAGLGIGAAIGAAAHTTTSNTLGGTTLTASSPKGLAIGSLVGLAAGGIVALVLITHSRQFFVDVGSPMQMTLPQPVSLSQSQVADAVRDAQEHPAQVPPAASRPLPAAYASQGTCFTAGTPGTPPTIIPGTPAIGNSPGTPSTMIPGTPAIAGTPYPCP
jgi:hypothetical protein